MSRGAQNSQTVDVHVDSQANLGSDCTVGQALSGESEQEYDLLGVVYKTPLASISM